MSVQVTCECGTMFEAEDSSADGQAVCEECRKSSMPPLPPPVPEDSPMSPPVPVEDKFCYICTEKVPVNFVVCPFCRTVLKEYIPEEERLERLGNATAELNSLVSGRIDEASSFSTITTRTIVWAAFSVLSFGVTATGFAVKDMSALITFGILALIIFIPSFLVSLGNDLATQTGKKDKDPRKVFKAFFNSLLVQRPARAFARLAPSARNNESPDLPVFTKVKQPKGPFKITDAKSLKGYWNSFIKSDSLNVRTAKLKKINILDSNERFAIIETEVKFSSYPASIIITIVLGVLIAVLLILIMKKEETRSIRKLLIKGRDGRWYIAESEMSGILDQFPHCPSPQD